ncbi:hypothetical protein FNV43_RR01659 [Rhamnella rubrinervis]|uniref:Uncharacterized protein n=1 Tax=Rhamnella rubrinervis TaxID=2594499 RepID=A0A8K0HQ86_9ROSA|nr:hypothetical protein FNV43_RR01659 [Rhamnella rubrinervis]
MSSKAGGFGTLFFNKSIVDELQNKIQRLGEARKAVQDAVDGAEGNGREIRADVQEWLTHVQEITQDAKKFNEELAAVAFPNIVLLRRLSKKAKKIIEKTIAEIQHAERFGNNVSYRPTVRGPTEIKESEAFSTREQTLDGIMEALKDPNVRTVGVWGMGGVGKTKLAKDVGTKVKDEFSEVVFTCVSRIPNFERIQQEIGERLGVHWQRKSLSGRAHQLVQRLRRENNNILVIVDDVWDNHDMDKVGIPFRDNKDGCKILVTSRFQHVLQNVGTDNTFQELRMSTSNNMQQSVHSVIKLSYNVLESEDQKSLLLLCSLFQEDESISIKELCNYGIGLNLLQGIDNLEEARQRTSDLVKILKDHQLLFDSEQGDGFVRLHGVIRDVVLSIASKDKQMYNVTSAAELDKYSYKEKLKGATALSLYNVNVDQYTETIESPELKLTRLIWRNSSPLQIPHQIFKGLNGHKVLDLRGVHLNPLPSSFSLLQNLQTLHLVKCTLGDITSVGELKNLQILDLSYSTFEELPSEIGQLQRLQYLNLQSCLFLQVIQRDVISRLTRLEELNLEQSFMNWDAEVSLDGREIHNASLKEVMNLPHLTNLSLNVMNVDILPKDMFSEKLEKYKIVIGTQGPNNLVENNSSRLLVLKLSPNSSLDEYDFEATLKRSEDLHLIGLKKVKNVAYMLDIMGFPQLKHLRLEDSDEIRRIVNSIGNILSRPPALPSLETLHLKGLKNLEMIAHGNLLAESFGKLTEITVKICGKLKGLFSVNIARKLERITVEHCMMMEQIISHGREGDVLNDYREPIDKNCQLLSLRLKNLPKLVEFCSKFVTPSTSEESDNQGIHDSAKPLFKGEVELPKLESLELESLNFEYIWNYPQLPSSFSFQSLKILIVVGCDSLNSLIPFSMIGNLVHLQSLCVERCKAMKEVVFIKESSGEEGNASEKILTFRRLENVKLRSLPNLERFCPGDNVDCPSLLNLEIKDCLKLQTVFSNSMPTSNNTELKTVSSPDINIPLFHKNKNWEITSQSHELVAVEKHGHLIFRHSRVVTLRNLPDAVLQLDLTFPNVETLHIIICDKLKVVSATPSSSSMSFKNLTILTVSACHGLTSLFYPSTVQSLPQLTKLSICWCKGLRGIIASDHQEGHDDHEIEEEVLLTGSSLNQLVVSRSPNLKSFSVGMIESPKLKTIAGDIIGLSFELFDRNLTDTFDFIEDKFGTAQHFQDSDINAAVQNLLREGDNSSEALQLLFDN